MRRVLFIAYLFPPIANSGTRRSLEFVNHLPNHDWEPTVLTVDDKDQRPDRFDSASLSEIRPGTRVERAELISDVLALKIASLLPGALRTAAESSFSWRLRRVWRFPDDAAAWRPTARALGLELLRKERFDLIYATGSPWTAFLLAEDLHRASGIPFVIDYRDVWTPSGDVPWQTETRLQSLYRRRNQRRLGKSAAAVVTVTPSLAVEIGSDIGRDDLVTITNGFEPKDFSTRRAAIDSTSQVTVCYTGVWRVGYGPHLLYAAARAIKDVSPDLAMRLRIEMAGFSPDAGRTQGLLGVVTEHGPVSHAKAIDMMVSANLLFLCVPQGAYSKTSLPGKLFEYIGAGAPILAAVPKDSEVARVLNEVGGAVVIEPDDLAGAIDVLTALYSGRPLPGYIERRAESVTKYSRAGTTKALANVFDRCVALPRKLGR